MTKGPARTRTGTREGAARRASREAYRATLDDPRPLLTVAQVAERLACSRTTAYRLINDGDLRAVTVASDLRVRPADLDAYIAGLAS